MTPEEKISVFDHVKKALIPASESKMKKFIKAEVSKNEINTSRRLQQIIKLEPVLDDKIESLKELLKLIETKIKELDSIEERLTILEDTKDDINKEAILDLITNELD